MVLKELVEILVPLGFFTMVTLIVIFTARYRHRERLEMIKSGMNPAAAVAPVPGRGALVWGLLLTFGGVGHGLGVLLLSLSSGALVPVFVLVPVGLALLLYYRLTAPQRRRAEELWEAMRGAAERPNERTPAGLSPASAADPAA